MSEVRSQPKKQKREYYKRETGQPTQKEQYEHYKLLLDAIFQAAKITNLKKVEVLSGVLLSWPEGKLTPDAAMREMERYLTEATPKTTLTQSQQRKAFSNRDQFLKFLDDVKAARLVVPGIAPERIEGSSPLQLIRRFGRHVPQDSAYWKAYTYAVEQHRKTYHSSSRGRGRTPDRELLREVLDHHKNGQSLEGIAILTGQLSSGDSDEKARKAKSRVSKQLKRARELEASGLI